MLNKEIMDWGCKFADGFEYDILHSDGEYPYIRCYNGASHYLGDFPFHDIDFDLWENVYYPLFLQKTIEGLSKEYGFDFDPYYNKSTNQWNYMFFNKYNTQYPDSEGLLTHTNNVVNRLDIDEAKEQAIKYIYEEINK